MSRRFRKAGVALGVVVFAYGCTVRTIVEVTVASVEVQPSSITILEGETQRLTAEVKDDLGRDLPNGEVTWSSDAPSVFLIDPISGEGLALAPGQATIWATQSGTRGSASVSVEPGPSIVVSEPSLFFLGALGGAAPDPFTVRITNGGGGSVGGISATVQYPEGAAAGWLSLALDGTSAPTTVTVSSQLGLLAEGVYEATVVLASQDARIVPVAVPVQAVVVLDTPVIGLSPRALDFQLEAAGGPPAPQTVQITNQGGGVLSDLEAVSLYLGVGGWLSASLTETTAPTELLVQPDPSGLGAGVYRAEVRISGPGALNTPLSVAVTFTIEVGAVSPAHSTATVPAGTAGVPTNIIVQARDENGSALSSGGAAVVVTVSGSNVAGPMTATDAGDGTYSASYTPIAAGPDDVAIIMDGTPLGGSPFVSMVGAGSASPAHSTATVPAGTAGVPTSIVVRARDEHGNSLSSGGATVVVTVSGANAAGPITATDAGDGTYAASYTPTQAGPDEVAIIMDGTPLGGSPFVSMVGVGSVSPAHSTATVPAGTAGRPTDIVVQARDESGNSSSSGGAKVALVVSGANVAGPIEATDVGDGTYTASYTPTTAGTDEVAITMDGTPLGGSPFVSMVAVGSVSPVHSTATVPPGTAGLPTNIVVQARDEGGNALSSGGATVAVTVSGANAVQSITVTDVGDGTYTASYTPTVAGTDEVAITMDGTPLGGGPFISMVGVASVSPAHSTAIVPSGKRRHPTNIVVQARDAYGNPLGVGGEIVVISVFGKNPTGPIAATDVGDGTYTATYTPESRGTDFVAITMNGIAISGSPFISRVKRR